LLKKKIYFYIINIMIFKYHKYAARMMITKIAITLFSLFPLLIYCQNHGFKYIKNYSHDDYKLHPQNWSVRQDKRGVIYVGTTSGLFVMEPPRAISREQHFIPVTGITSACFSLLAAGDTVLAATTDGLFQLDTRNRRLSQFSQFNSYILLRSRADANRLWVAIRGGLQSFYLTTGAPPGRWKLEHSFENINLPVRSMVEDEQGTLWLGVPGKGAAGRDREEPFPT
jgi:hypothetical protein